MPSSALTVLPSLDAQSLATTRIVAGRNRLLPTGPAATRASRIADTHGPLGSGLSAADGEEHCRCNRNRRSRCRPYFSPLDRADQRGVDSGAHSRVAVGVLWRFRGSLGWTRPFWHHGIFGQPPPPGDRNSHGSRCSSAPACWRLCRRPGMRHTWILPSRCAPSKGKPVAITSGHATCIAAMPDWSRAGPLTYVMRTSPLKSTNTSAMSTTAMNEGKSPGPYRYAAERSRRSG